MILRSCHKLQSVIITCINSYISDIVTAMGTLRNEKPSEMLIKTIRYSARLVVFARCFLDRHSSVEQYNKKSLKFLLSWGILGIGLLHVCFLNFFSQRLGDRVLQKAKLHTCDSQFAPKSFCFLGIIYVLSLFQF